ncbi:MAG: hypothetical protein WBG65_01085 [Sulfurimonadaceae bacterium]
MKKLLILSIVSLVPMAVMASTEAPDPAQVQKIKPAEAPDHAQINKQIREIKPPRTGVKTADVLNTKSPFILLKTGKDGKKATYAVKNKVKFPPLRMESAINKNVKINGKWYKEGDRVRQYTIMNVSSGEVLLKSKKKELKLFQNQKNDKIQFNVN